MKTPFTSRMRHKANFKQSFTGLNWEFPFSKTDCNKMVKELSLTWGCPCGVKVKAMDCGIVEREFVLQSRYYVHFRANTLGKVMNPLILPVK